MDSTHRPPSAICALPPIVTAYRLFVRFATLFLVLLAIAIIVLVVAARSFDTETVLVMGIALGLVIFFGSLPVLFGALAKRKQDR